MPAWEKALYQLFVHHQRRYGTRRLRAELRAQGYQVGRQRIRNALRRRELVAVQPQAFGAVVTLPSLRYTIVTYRRDWRESGDMIQQEPLSMVPTTSSPTSSWTRFLQEPI